MPRLPDPRGETSDVILDALRRRPATGDLPAHAPAAPDDPLADEDLHLSLYLCYELHYRGFDEVDERWEWSPALLALRAALEECFEAGLHAALGAPSETVAAEETDLALREIAEDDDAPSLSAWIERTAEVEHVREFLVHRSAYQLKEADPHSWAIP
ncbi:MAG: iron-containing redox enzyme family protein, partial [Solirubrobacteraceae bacterium]